MFGSERSWDKEVFRSKTKKTLPQRGGNVFDQSFNSLFADEANQELKKLKRLQEFYGFHM